MSVVRSPGLYSVRASSFFIESIQAAFVPRALPSVVSGTTDTLLSIPRNSVLALKAAIAAKMTSDLRNRIRKSRRG
jgi:hypothetical protein